MGNTHNNYLIPALAMVIITGTGVNLAQATGSKTKEAKELQFFQQAKITLSEAIKAAEQKTGGKAMEAELDDEANTVQFEIEILKDGKVHEVKVDGITGKIVNIALEAESDDGNEKENGKE